MSRTEGVSLPRLPRPHTRVTSPGAIRPHQATRDRQLGLSKAHRRALSEPSYTAYLGTPRQDVPHQVYRDAAMFDEVFDKKGALLLSRNTPKVISPLNSLQYNSLHDPHCQKLFLNNKKLRSHLVNMGLITCDLKVVASTSEQRQKIRAHELLERREQLTQKLEEQEQQRLERLQHQMQLPQLYRESILKDERRRQRAEELQRMKLERILRNEAEKEERERKSKEERQRKLKAVIEAAKLRDQAKRNSARVQQEIAEMIAYEKQYGKFGRQLALWHRESDEIHNKMIMMERKYWARMRQMRQQQLYAESSTRSSSASSGSAVDVESIATLHHSSAKTSTPLPDGTQPTEAESAETKDDTTAAQEIPQPTVTEGEEETKKETEETAELVEGGEKSPPAEGEEQLKEVEGEKEPAETIRAPDITEEGLETEKSEEKAGEEDVTKPPETIPAHEGSVVIVDREDSGTEFTKILLEAFRRDRDIDANLGYLQLEEFIQVLNSRDLGLQLNEQELFYIAEQVDINVNGWIPLVQVVPLLPDLLLAIYKQRAEQAMQYYGNYLEEQWCMLYLSDGGVAYFNKLTGILQYGGRPEDFRPYLKDEAFEEAIVDFFETADTNKYGVLDYNDFSTLLESSMVSDRVYSHQMEELRQLYEGYSMGGFMTLGQFGVVAKALLIMIYQNAYPNVGDWIELQTRKYGTVLFNKQTGEVAAPPGTASGQGEDTMPATPATVTAASRSKKREKAEHDRTMAHHQEMSGEDEEGDDQEAETPQPALRKRKKQDRRVSWSDDPTPTSRGSQEASSRPVSQTAPPPLRRRRSKSQEKSRSATDESISSQRNKEEASTPAPATSGESNQEQSSATEDTIPIPESDSIPKAEATSSNDLNAAQNSNTEGPIPAPQESNSISEADNKLPDSSTSEENKPDANNETGTDLQSETTESKEPIPSPQDPIPTDSTNVTTENLTENTKETVPEPKDSESTKTVTIAES